MTPLARQYLLMVPRAPSGRDPVPPGFGHAAAEYELALAAYDARRFEEAAAAFVSAAGLLRLPATAAYLDVAAASREAYLYDAACAWLMAATPARARAELQRLEADGRATRAELRRAFEVVEGATR